MEAIYREFGRQLRTARRKADLTQENLAKRVGLSRTSITNIEQGRQHVGLHLLYELASAVGVSPIELLPDDTGSNEDRFESVLVKMKPEERSKVQEDMRELPEDVRQQILRLVNEEGASGGSP